MARYNEFRRALFLIPISKWEDLTDDDEAIKTLREVYGDNVEDLDLQVAREADRFFTSAFNEEMYTKKGLEWVNTTETLKDVLGRHYPEMTNKWMNSTSAFTVWDAPPESPNPVPLNYLRVPK